MARKIDDRITDYIATRKAGKLGGLYEIKHFTLTCNDQSEDNTELWYRGTCIFRIVGNPKVGQVITLDNGGYVTPTTKSKINAALAGVLPASYTVYQRKYTWLISNPKGDDFIWTTDKVRIELDKHGLVQSIESV